MKRIDKFTIGLILCALLTGCHKNQDINKTPKISQSSPEIMTNHVVFEWTVDWVGKLASVVEVSEDADMNQSQTYGSETETEDHSFKVTVTGLKGATIYYYRYLVWNQSYVDNKFKMEIKSFVTKSDAPKAKTVDVAEVTHNSAVVTAEVMDENGSSVTERGVCWGTAPNPTINGDHLDNGNGTGLYSISISDLLAGQTYYVRAYAINANGTGYGSDLTFVTSDAIKPAVTVLEIADIDWRKARIVGEVTDNGGLNDTERGACWSTSHNPETSGDHASGGFGAGRFTVDMTGLSSGTTYYVRAYAKNTVGMSYGDEVSFVTKSPEVPTVTTSSVTSLTTSSAIGNGIVTSDGGVEVTECGFYYGTSSNLLATGTKIVASSLEDGAFSGLMENLDEATAYFICAYATNNQGTGYGGVMSFRTLVEGAMSHCFSVDTDRKVCFSKGNLQYQASTNTWRFAEEQYDFIGEDNKNASSDYDGWVDLFAWGTSGWNSGANCYQPWSHGPDSYFYPGGSEYNDLTGNYANADWGVYNHIGNGGNQEGLWRTLTKDEWVYVFGIRQTTSGIRYAKACVNNVNGVILLPDDWNGSFSLNNPNEGNASYDVNTITISQWSVLEQSGVVFLPASGWRSGITSVYWINVDGHYWSVSHYDYNQSCVVSFWESSLSPYDYTFRGNGSAVRLVYPAY